MASPTSEFRTFQVYEQVFSQFSPKSLEPLSIAFNYFLSRNRAVLCFKPWYFGGNRHPVAESIMASFPPETVHPCYLPLTGCDKLTDEQAWYIFLYANGLDNSEETIVYVITELDKSSELRHLTSFFCDEFIQFYSKVFIKEVQYAQSHNTSLDMDLSRVKINVCPEFIELFHFLPKVLPKSTPKVEYDEELPMLSKGSIPLSLQEKFATYA